MTIATDYEGFIKLLRSYPRAMSNDYYLPSWIFKMIESRKLSYSASEDALFLFERRDGFTKLVFHLIGGASELPPCEERLASYLLYRENSPPKASADWLLGGGFRHVSTSARLIAKKPIVADSMDGIEDASADETYEMMRECFDATDVDMPDSELFESAICVRTDSGKPAGVLYCGRTQVVAVAQEMRGMGIGRRLYMAYAAMKLEENKNAILRAWVNLDNAASLALHTRLGFCPDGALADLYEK